MYSIILSMSQLSVHLIRVLFNCIFLDSERSNVCIGSKFCVFITHMLSIRENYNSTYNFSYFDFPVTQFIVNTLFEALDIT